MGGASWWVGLAVVQRLKCIDGHRLGPRKVAVVRTLCGVDRDSLSLVRATPVWKNRGLVTALHTTSSDRQNLDGSRE